MGKESKRRRRVEIIRYSRRITVIHDGYNTIDFAAPEETAADIAPNVPDDSQLMVPAVSGRKLAGRAAAEGPLRRQLLKFFAWLRWKK